MTFLRRLTPAAKMLAMFVVAVVTTSKQSLDTALPILLYLLAVNAIGGVDMGRLARDMLPIVPFFVGLPVGNAIIASLRGGDPVGLAAQVACMLGVLVMLAAMFAYTTSPDDFAYSLALQFRLPFQIAFSVGLAYNFLTYVMIKYRRVHEALRARRLATSPLSSVKYLVPVLVNLMYSIIRRVDNLAIAMEMKRFGSPGRTFRKELRWRRSDSAFLAITLAVSIAVYVSG